MPDNGPSAMNDLCKNIFLRFIDLVNIQIEIIIDDITCRSNANRCDHQPGKCTVIIFLKDRLVNGIIE
jgi:hypothetical protein